MERASAAIAAAGGPGDAPRIEGPQGKRAVWCSGATVSLRGVAVAASGYDNSAVKCGSQGCAELAGCALSSPGGPGLTVVDGATADLERKPTERTRAVRAVAAYQLATLLAHSAAREPSSAKARDEPSSLVAI